MTSRPRVPSRPARIGSRRWRPPLAVAVALAAVSIGAAPAVAAAPSAAPARVPLQSAVAAGPARSAAGYNYNAVLDGDWQTFGTYANALDSHANHTKPQPLNDAPFDVAVKHGLRWTRTVVPWDVMAQTAAGSCDDDVIRNRHQLWNCWLFYLSAYNQASGQPPVKVNVGFEWQGEKGDPYYRKAPSLSVYAFHVAAFMNAYGGHVAAFDPWNEPNYHHAGSEPLLGTGGPGLHDKSRCRLGRSMTAQLDTCGPYRAAAYYRIAYQQVHAWCAANHVAAGSCPLVVAGEFAGGVKGTSRYVQWYKRGLSLGLRSGGKAVPAIGSPDRWSVHNYGDVAAYERTGDTRAPQLHGFLNQIYCTGSNSCTRYGTHGYAGSTLWIGATGVFATYGRDTFSWATQERAARFLYGLTALPNVTLLFYYNLAADHHDRWQIANPQDRSLVSVYTKDAAGATVPRKTPLVRPAFYVLFERCTRPGLRC